MSSAVLEKIKISQGDITQLEVDAIVNAANERLAGGGGVDGAIHRAAGSELLAECRAIGGCPTGEARITKGYNLKARFVIHTVGPIYKGRPEDATLLANCYRNSLALALQHSIQNIAFPAISCGVYGYPIKDACKIAIDETHAFLQANNQIQEVIFMLFSEADLNIYKNYLAEIAH